MDGRAGKARILSSTDMRVVFQQKRKNDTSLILGGFRGEREKSSTAAKDKNKVQKGKQVFLVVFPLRSIFIIPAADITQAEWLFILFYQSFIIALLFYIYTEATDDGG